MISNLDDLVEGCSGNSLILEDEEGLGSFALQHFISKKIASKDVKIAILALSSTFGHFRTLQSKLGMKLKLSLDNHSDKFELKFRTKLVAKSKDRFRILGTCPSFLI